MPEAGTLSIKSASIVEFEFENILFSVKVKWSGGEEYFSPWSIECDVGAVFFYKSLKTRGRKNKADSGSSSVVELTCLCRMWSSPSAYIWYLIMWLGCLDGALLKLNFAYFYNLLHSSVLCDIVCSMIFIFFAKIVRNRFYQVLGGL